MCYANASSILGDQDHGEAVRCQNGQSAPTLLSPLRICLMPGLIDRLNDTGTVNLPEPADCWHGECVLQAPAVLRHMGWLVTDMITRFRESQGAALMPPRRVLTLIITPSMPVSGANSGGQYQAGPRRRGIATAQSSPREWAPKTSGARQIQVDKRELLRV